MIKFLDLHAQYLSIKDEMDAAMSAVIRDSAYVGGPYLQRFEEEFAAYIGAKYCVGVANGTDAIEIALEALDLPKGSEVIVPANSFIATSEAVTRSGFRVVFADIDPISYNLTPETVKPKLTDKTSAIAAVHLYGQMCDVEALQKLAPHLKIIEDSAQAHGAECRGRRAGTVGNIATFSFYPGKNLGAYGDGGAIITNDEALAKQSRKIANHGRTAKYDHDFEGRNSRLDGLQSAILSVKLKHLDGWINHRNLIADHYRAGLKGMPDLVLPQTLPDRRHGYHLFVVRTSRRDELKAYLAEQGIETGIHYPIALPRLAAYAYLGQQEAPMFANQTDRMLLSLPIGEHLSLQQIDTVIEAIKTFFAANSASIRKEAVG